MQPSDVDQYKVIDTDTHVIEPYDLWTSRLSVERWGDKVPHVRWDEALQEDAWFFGEKRVGAAAGAAQAGWNQFPPQHPPRLGDVDPATWNAEERLRIMDKYGIWSAVLYPNVAGFGAGKMLTIGDHELMLACVRAYNDFLAEYCAIDPRRFVPIMALPFWDLEATEAEIERALALGHKGVIMTGEPGFWNMPKLADPHWDRLWATCQANGLSVNFHIGSGDMSIFDRAYDGAGEHANYAGFGVQFGVANVSVVANLITGGVCHRFPDLKFVSVESGVGWLPFALEHLDWQWKNCGVPQEHPEYDLLPSEYFLRQMYGCFWFEGPTVKAAIEQFGSDWILYESDFPHPTSMAPGPASSAVEPREYIAKELGDIPEPHLRKILHDNAAALYHLD
ncbi:amidohydrolase family protein [Desertimonas flava]|jgi:predicted TIM-barrel fold metal-dependent hydrolase|uniref:amidohydrolase family protein n=1 Tax=Desertimonas flava TaxID=2064846 RepID=UPI000E34932F|nr:amidohydrolase family protein [Desertimonas flava]